MAGRWRSIILASLKVCEMMRSWSGRVRNCSSGVNLLLLLVPLLLLSLELMVGRNGFVSWLFRRELSAVQIGQYRRLSRMLW